MNNLIIDGNIWVIILWFASYSFLGWVWESIYRSIVNRRFINSGFLAGPFIPIYGFGALLYILLMHVSINPFFLFFVGGILACMLEYITSWLLEKIFHARWWDYSKEKLNINGRVCLIGFLAFAFFAAILPYIQLGVGQLINILTEGWRIAIAIIFILTILIDLFHTSRGLIKLNKTLAHYQAELERHAAPFIDIARKGKEHTLELLINQHHRIMDTFPAFKSIKYPETFKKVRKLYKETRYQPEGIKKPAPRKRRAKHSH
ncbi:putative ABC transporter permease [Candidatus Saccharibacteria bacterium]|nr:putative ABC transporter permease [Candidatus Saccharibacteria bacterium]